METSKIRVSVANLAWFVRVKGTGIRHYFAIVNQKNLLKGERQYMALGGGAMLTEQGKSILEVHYEASSFELDPHTGFFDARFKVDEGCNLGALFSHFTVNANKALEQGPTLDIIAELTGSESGHASIFTAEETEKILVLPVGVVQQKPSAAGADTSGRALAEMPTRRLFRTFELVMPNELFEKMQRSSAVRFLSDAELTTTEGGSKAGRTNDGFLIQNNLFLM